MQWKVIFGLVLSTIIILGIILSVVMTRSKPDPLVPRTRPEIPSSEPEILSPIISQQAPLALPSLLDDYLRWGVRDHAETCLSTSCFHVEANVVELQHDVVTNHFSYSFKIAPADSAEDRDLSISPPVVMVFETEYHEAFAHWVYESAIHFAAFQALRQRFPEAKLLLQGKRKYKKLLLDKFGWTYEHDVIFELPFPNRCYFCPLFCLNDRAVMNVDVFRNLYLQLFQFLMPEARDHATVPVLYLPRSHVENFVYNDRTILSSNEIRDWCLEKGGRVLEVHTIDDLRDQISGIQTAKTVVLDYGSSLLVNGLFARSGTNLIILNNMNQHLDYPAYGAIWKDIQARCNTRFVDRLQNSVNLQFHITDVEKAYQELVGQTA